MPTQKSVLQCFQLLRTAGVKGGPDLTDAAQVDTVSRLWVHLMPELDDADLQRAVEVYLRGEHASWWPVPGSLLHLVPRIADALADTAAEDWARVHFALHLGSKKPKGEALNHALDVLGSWYDLKRMTLAQLRMSRPAFIETHRAFTHRRRRSVLALDVRNPPELEGT